MSQQMKNNKSTSRYYYEWLCPYEAERDTVVLLHGFTSSSQTFKGSEAYLTNYNLLAVDLIGHGQSPSPVDIADYDMAVVCEALTLLMAELGLRGIHVLGYSMGARTALAWSVAQPQLIKSVILESGSPGLGTATERDQRRASDDKLADRIEKEGLLSFVYFWEQLPLFQSQERLTSKVKEKVRGERLSQNELGLANSLRGMGTGRQKNYWSALVKTELPIYCLTGALDEKFCLIATKMAACSPLISHETLSGLGHCLHLEDPARFYDKVGKILKDVTMNEDN